MQHEKQLDPTEIVVIPYNLTRLCVYTLITLAVATASADRPTAQLMEVLRSSIVVFLAMLLCGASPFDNLAHTYLAAVYLVTLCTLDPPRFIGNDGDSVRPQQRSLWQRLYPPQQTGRSSSRRGGEPLGSTICCCTTLALTIPFEVLLLYDRGWQWQRWPLPVMIGSTLGWALGCVMGTVWVRVEQQDDRAR